MQTITGTVNVINVKPKEFLPGRTFNGVIINVSPFNLGQKEGIKATAICGNVGKTSNGQQVFETIMTPIVDLTTEIVEQWGTDDTIIEDFVLESLDIYRL